MKFSYLTILFKHKSFVFCAALTMATLLSSFDRAYAQHDFLMLNYLDVERAIDQKIKDLKAIKYKFEADTLSKKGSIVFSLTNEPENLWIIGY